MVTTVWHL